MFLKKILFIALILLIPQISFAQGFGELFPKITIQDEDGSPTGKLKILKVTNGSLTNNGGGSFSLSTSGGAGTPGGSTTQVQYNDAGSFAGDAGFTYDQANNALIVNGRITSDSLVVINGAAYLFVTADSLGGITLDSIGGSNPNINFPDNIRLQFSDSPDVQLSGQLAFDTDAWASGRGAIQIYDGTASNYVVGILTSETCSNLQVPKWNTGGTWTCEDDNNSSAITGADTLMIFMDGANNPTVDPSGVSYNKTTNTVSADAFETTPNTAPKTTYKDSDAADGDVNGQIDLNCPTTTSGGENCQLNFRRQVGGILTQFFSANADRSVTVDSITVRGGYVTGDSIAVTGPITTDSLVVAGRITADSLFITTEVYSADNWNEDMSVPPKDAVRDKIETMPQTAGRSLTLTTTTVDADAETYAHTFCFRLPPYPVASDDLQSIWFNDTANQFTVTELWCESDQTVTMMVQVDDGSVADMDSVDLVCISTPDTDSSLDGDATLAAGDRVDLDIASVASTPTWATICWSGTWDD